VACRATTRSVPPLDHVLGLSSVDAPAGTCPNCWRAWLAGPRDSIGYCWHGKVAWRVKSGALVVLPGVTREEHRAMLEYIDEMEAIIRPTDRVPPQPAAEGQRAATDDGNQRAALQI
jgi:hypothetical protein